MPISKTPFGRVRQQDVDIYTLKNSVGAYVRVCPFGATVSSIVVPDQSESLTEVSLGYGDIDSYLNDTAYLGSVIGRYGNRIENGLFVLDGESHHLHCNVRHLH